MIHLTDAHYTAIGKVTVESCTLDREVTEYLSRIGSPKNGMLGDKLKELQKELSSRAPVGQKAFDCAFQKIKGLIKRRNAIAHGVWIPAPNLVGSAAKGKSASVHASEIESVAAKLRIARKLVLRLCHEYYPIAAGQKKCPKAAASKLQEQLQ